MCLFRLSQPDRFSSFFAISLCLSLQHATAPTFDRLPDIFLFQKNKVFAVLGPYRHIREGMRRRGWVEKFYRAPLFTIDERVLVLLSSSSQATDNQASAEDSTNEDVDIIHEEKNPTTVSGELG